MNNQNVFFNPLQGLTEGVPAGSGVPTITPGASLAGQRVNGLPGLGSQNSIGAGLSPEAQQELQMEMQIEELELEIMQLMQQLKQQQAQGDQTGAQATQNQLDQANGQLNALTGGGSGSGGGGGWTPGSTGFYPTGGGSAGGGGGAGGASGASSGGGSGSTGPAPLPASSYGPTGPLTNSTATPSQNGFGKALLKAIGAPITPQNLQFLDAWQKAEGGSPDNPFNTTQGAPGATDFNSVGVKRYPNMQEGLNATVQTLQNGHYNNIISSLRQGNNAMASAQAVANSPWGTGAGVEHVLGG